MQVDEILEEIRKTKEIERVLKNYDWKDFESFVEFVFQQHDYETKRNFRFKTDKRYEVDIIAEKNVIICVDCKRLSSGRSKRSFLKNSAERHKKRTEELGKFSKKDKKLLPLIITLMDEDIIEYQNVIILPIWKINDFILSLDAGIEYTD